MFVTTLVQLAFLEGEGPVSTACACAKFIAYFPQRKLGYLLLKLRHLRINLALSCQPSKLWQDEAWINHMAEVSITNKAKATWDLTF